MKAKVAAKPGLVQIGTAYKQQPEGEKTIPRNKCVEIREGKPDTPEKAKWPEFKTCKYTTEAIVADGTEKGELRKVCTEPTCPIHHPKKQMPKTGIKLKVDGENAAKSESLVEKQFQLQFNEIFHKGLLSLQLANVPTVYAVNSVNKIRQTPFRLSVKFQTDTNGKSVEREDFEILKSSDYVHEQITVELNRLARPNNLVDVAKAVIEIEDSDTLKLFDAKANSVNLQFLEDLIKLEANSQARRTSFLGPIYSSANWKLLQKRLAPVLTSRIDSKEELGADPFIWLAPSDPYWCKSNQLLGSLSDFLSRERTKHKRLYSPTLYLPVSGPDDFRTVRQWKNELDPFTGDAHGLIEGFLGGNVEVMYFEGELVVVVYHMSIPDAYSIAK